jgi:hypothetical protein
MLLELRSMRINSFMIVMDIFHKWCKYYLFIYIVFINVSEKIKYFNTGSVSHNVNIQSDIMQNYWKKQENHKYFEITL